MFINIKYRRQYRHNNNGTKPNIVDFTFHRSEEPKLGSTPDVSIALAGEPPGVGNVVWKLATA